MNDGLRGCPTCLTPVSQAKLGMRDFSWLEDSLPGRVAPMDIDFALEKNGRFLFLEFKPEGGGISVGARITYKTLVKAGHDVWIVWGDDPITVGAMDRWGDIPFVTDMTAKKLAGLTKKWYEGASNDGH